MKIISICIVSLVCCTLAVPLEKETNKKVKKARSKLTPKFNNCKSPFEICNSTTSYPKKFIQKLVKKKKNLPLFSRESLIEPAQVSPVPTMRDAIEPKNLCRTQTMTTFPKAGYDFHSKEQRFIVNIDDYVQSVVYEICLRPNLECSKETSYHFPLGYQTLCKQKYNIVRLVSLTKEGNIEYGKFMVPSTCICSYVQNDFGF